MSLALKHFEVTFALSCVVPFEAKDRQRASNWALRLGAEEIIHRRDPKQDKIAVIGIREDGNDKD